MKIAGEFTFAAPRPLVWDALQDPRVLASVLPGCESLELVGDHEYEGKLKVKIGPVQGDYVGRVTLTDLDAPQAFRMAVDGRGQQGWVKATASIALAEEGATTRITYDSDAQVGGRIASVGQRLIETSARAIVRQSLEGLDTTMRARAETAEHVVAQGGTVEMAVAAAAEVAPPEEARTTEAQVAASVAREVAKDLGPVIARRAAIFVAVAAIGWLLWSRLR